MVVIGVWTFVGVVSVVLNPVAELFDHEWAVVRKDGRTSGKDGISSRDTAFVIEFHFAIAADRQKSFGMLRHAGRESRTHQSDGVLHSGTQRPGITRRCDPGRGW